MKQNSFSKKRIIHIYVIIFSIIMIILIAGALMLKYQVEGEKNLPFNLKKINIVSTAESDLNMIKDNTWSAGISQKNNIYFVIEKNLNYKREVGIRRISFENFEITKSNDNMEISFYRPKETISEYEYIEDYKFENSIEYEGALATNTEVLQINNQGGIIGFSIISTNIGEYIFEENEVLPSDGKLLAKAGIGEEEFKFQISFDLTIETTDENKFKSNIKLDLPVGNILENGVGTKEDTSLENVVFKRVK